MRKKRFLAMLIGYLLIASAGMVLCNQEQEDIPLAEAEKRAVEILREAPAISEISEWLRVQYNKMDSSKLPAGSLTDTIKGLRIDQVRLLEILNLSVQRDCKLNLVGDDPLLADYRKSYNTLPELLKVVIGDYIVTTGPDMRKPPEPEVSQEAPAAPVPKVEIKETKISDDTVRVEASQPAIPFVVKSIEEKDQKIGSSDADTPTPAAEPAKQHVAPAVEAKPVEKIAAPVKPIPMDRPKLSRMEIRRQRRARRRGMKPLAVATPIAPASAKPVVPIEAVKAVETVER